MDPHAGARVSHYQLIRKLGSGGMGDVYLADDLHLGRAVAIKFLNAPTDARARQRLLNEARAAASLDHPVICGVHEVGSDPLRGDFIVMQYVEGETLASTISRGPLPREQALAIAADIADALAAAHQHGIIHRDLKPQNIVLQPSGHAKLLDFGIAKRLTSEHAAAEATTSTPLTRPHAMIGTPSYMAPEQVKGDVADARSDLFALGCVVYECVTGRRAFAGVTSGEVFGQILHAEPPPMSTVTPRVDPDLDALVARLLRKAPAERFQSASEVVGAIRTLRGLTTRDRSGAWASPISARPAPRAYFLIAAAAIVVAAAVGLWWRSGALPTPPDGARVWYDRGVEALRDGAYLGARSAFEEAIRVFPDYAFAYSRLAEACAQLDDDGAAREALLRASALGDDWRLPRAERLRLEAVRFTVLRDHDRAIEAYDALVDDSSQDAGLWVDAGRAEEAAGRLGKARDRYARAVQIDPQYATAHMRLGYADGQAGHTKEAMASFDEAIRLYRAGSRVEGEAEALVRKAARLVGNDNVEARVALDRAIIITADGRYLSQRLRARFLAARIELGEGRPLVAETIASEAITQATSAGLDRDAADGLMDLSNAYMALRLYEDADAALVRAIALAAGKGARLTEMRARLQQAYLRLRTGRAPEAITMAQAPLQFFHDGRYLGLEAQAKNILSRARENVGEFEEAQRLAEDVLAYAESIDSASLMSESLESLATLLTTLGRLPAALSHLERAEQIHRKGNLHSALRFDLPNRADLLVRLNRGGDARGVLDELRALITAGHPSYTNRGRRVGQVAAHLAATRHQFAELETEAGQLADDSAKTPDGIAIFGRVMREYARAHTGRSTEAVATITAWAGTPPALNRELAYWIGQTLVRRREAAAALALMESALTVRPLEENPELTWRLSAVAEHAIAGGAPATSGTNYAVITAEARRRLDATWGGHATPYFARADLAVLRPTR